MITNTFFTLFFLAILIMGLLNDFKRDEGKNKKAKIFQVICLGLIFLLYSKSIRYVGWIFRHFDKVQERFTVNVGIFSGQTHFLIFILNIALMLTVIILAFLMAKRHLKARQLFFYFLPLLAFTEMFNFYRGWLSDGAVLEVHPGIIFLIAFIICGGLTTGILLIYKSKFMKEFFNFNIAPTEEKETDK